MAGAAAGLGAVGGVPLSSGLAGFGAAAALPPIPAVPAPPTSEPASPPLDLLIKTPRSVAGTEAKSEPSPEQDPDAGPKVAEFYVKEYATTIERRIAHNTSTIVIPEVCARPRVISQEGTGVQGHLRS